MGVASAKYMIEGIIYCGDVFKDEGEVKTYDLWMSVLASK